MKKTLKTALKIATFLAIAPVAIPVGMLGDLVEQNTGLDLVVPGLAEDALTWCIRR